MKKILSPSQMRFSMVIVVVGLILAACNKPQASPQGTMDVTQAYQTVQVQLTQGVALTQIPTLTSTGLVVTTAVPDEASFAENPTPTLTPTQDQIDPEDEAETANRCDRAAPGYPNIDVTIEDDTEIQPGEKFTKTWRLTNTGTCTWNTNYQVVWFSGETLGVLQNYTLTENVPSGESIDISIELEAPLEPGTYQGNWKLKNPDGELFGIGPEGESSFWVRIVVPEVGTETPTPTATATATIGPQASGGVDLEVDDRIDLDTLQLNGGDVDLAYNWVQAGDEAVKHQLVPLGNAQIAIFGDTRPTLEACQSASLGAAPIIVEDLVPIAYLCYRTNSGLLGWLRFDGRDPDTNAINIEILTWALP